jgi:hypothetical protein
MKSEFSKFQGLLGYPLQILPADNLEGFKTQPTTKSEHKEHEERKQWNCCVFTRLCRS